MAESETLACFVSKLQAEMCLFPADGACLTNFFNHDVFCLLQRPHKAYPVELAQFHSVDYVEFLARITPESQDKYAAELIRCTLPEFSDCFPRVVDGL